MNELDLPLPDRKRDVVITDGYIDYASTLKLEDAEGKTGTSVNFRIPAGEHRLPRADDTRFRYDWGRNGSGKLRSTQETYIALTGAGPSQTILRGSFGSHALWRLPSYAIGIWRLSDLAAYDIPGHAIGFGTGPYNNDVHVGIIENVVGDRCTGNWMMLGAEWEGTPAKYDPNVKTICNDRRLFRNIQFSNAGHEHVIYNDFCDYTYVKNAKLWGGPHHPFKSIAKWTEVDGMVCSNVNPDTGKVDGTYGRNSAMSLVALCGGHYKNVKTLQVWPEDQPSSPGGYSVGIQPRWNMIQSWPEMANPASDEYWEDVIAGGLDNPENPFLHRHTHYFEDCNFETRGRPDRQFRTHVIGNGTSHPMLYGSGGRRGLYHPIPTNSPLWQERSRTYLLNCQAPGSYGWYKQALFWLTEYWPEYDAVIARDEPLRVAKLLSERPTWWPGYVAPPQRYVDVGITGEPDDMTVTRNADSVTVQEKSGAKLRVNVNGAVT